MAAGLQKKASFATRDGGRPAGKIPSISFRSYLNFVQDHTSIVPVRIDNARRREK
jgi:hypothetical protein